MTQLRPSATPDAEAPKLRPGPYRTPFAEPRPVPPGPARRPTYFPVLRTVSRAGAIITLLSVMSGAGCGLVSGGMHGLVFATALFSAIGFVGMSVAAGVAAALDGTRIARAAMGPGPILASGVLEHGIGQVSLNPTTGREDGALALSAKQGKIACSSSAQGGMNRTERTV